MDLQMKNFANIPIDSIFRTLGVQLKQTKNLEVLEIEPLYCKNCFRRLADSSACDTCPGNIHSVSVSGYTAKFDSSYNRTLKSASIKLFILLFFYSDSNGIIDSVNIRSLSDYIGCNKKTVIASLRSLELAGYIDYEKRNSLFYDIQILNYQDMYKKAYQGGRGYVTMDKELLLDIMKIKDLNSLRCIIKLLFKASYNQIKSASKLAAAKVSFDTLKDSLPDYVKPHILRNAVSNVRAFFHSVNEDYKEFVVVLAEKYQGAVIKERLKADGKIKIPAFIKEFNEKIDRINKDIENGGNLSFESISYLSDNSIMLPPAVGKYPGLNINSNVKNDLFNLCPQYGADSIIAALKIFFTEYIANHIRIENVGGLIRKILSERTEYGILSGAI